MVRKLPRTVRLAYEYRNACPNGARAIDARMVIQAWMACDPLPPMAAESLGAWDEERLDAWISQTVTQACRETVI